jgi:UDP-N-acetylglucosamine transferase subunit ALG13
VIFVTVGTHDAPFDRLLQAIDALELDEELIVQHGPSSILPSRAHCVDYLAFDDLVDHVRRARIVVAHAGVGTVLVVLASHKRPVVVPRLHSFREHVDDHQLDFARRVRDAGLVQLVEDPSRLGEILRSSVDAPTATGHQTGLADDLRAYLVSQLAPERAAAL